MPGLDALTADVARVLARDWDPIGLPPADATEAYRRYAIRVARLIDGGEDKHHVAGYLAKLRQSMGLARNEGVDAQVAARLVGLAQSASQKARIQLP